MCEVGAWSERMLRTVRKGSVHATAQEMKVCIVGIELDRDTERDGQIMDPEAVDCICKARLYGCRREVSRNRAVGSPKATLNEVQMRPKDARIRCTGRLQCQAVSVPLVSLRL
jgi:hypothetical protein